MIKIIVVVVMLFMVNIACADSWDNLAHDLSQMGIDAGPRPSEDPQVVIVETNNGSNTDYGTCQSSLTGE